MNDIPDSYLHPSLRTMKAKEFGHIIQHFQDAVYRYFLVSTKNHAIAEELTQDTFLKVWRERKKYKEEKLFSAWLFSIARNHLLDHKRKENLRARDHEFVTTKEQEKPKDYEDLHLALEQLTPEERQIIEMRYFEQQSCQNIGNALHKTDNAISVSLHKIRQKIHEFLTRKNHAKK